MTAAMTPRCSRLPVICRNNANRVPSGSRFMPQVGQLRVPVSAGANLLRIRLKDDFGLAYDSMLPALGSSSEGLRIVSESWSPAHDRLAIAVSGLAGHQYRLSVWDAAQIASVSGAKLAKGPDARGELIVEFPPNRAEPPSHKMISIQFASR